MEPPRRSAVLGALLGAAALLTTACGGLGSTAQDTGPAEIAPELAPNQQVEITFESYNLATTGAWSDTVNRLLANFQAEHPNIKVKGQPPQGASGSNAGANTVSSVQSQLVVGKAPDVAQLTFGDLDYAVHQLRPKALDDIVGDDAVQAHFGGEHPMHPRARGLAELDGKTYGMPYVFSTPVLYYNAELFRRAGLDPDKPPTTWAEVQQAALAIKNSTSTPGVYIDCLTKTSGDWCLQGLIRSNGGQVISPDRKALTFAEPAAVEAISMAQQLVKSGASPDLSQSQAMDAMGRGQLGMFLETSALQGSLQSQSAGKWELRAAPMPGFGDKPTVPTNSGSALFVLSDDKAKQRASWELIKYLTSDEAYQEISSKIGYLPLRTGLVDDPNGLKPWADRNPLLRPNLTQLDRLEPWVSFPGDHYVQIRDLMLQAVENSVYRGQDPQETLSEAQRRATELMPRS